MEKQDLNYSYLIREIGIRMKRIADIQLHNVGLNSQQGQMIDYIYEHQKQGIIQQDLAKRFQRKGASISSMLQGLEKKGYIKRVISPENERQKNIYVLEKGIDLITEFERVFSSIETALVAEFEPEEKAMLKKALAKMSANLIEMEASRK